jgi:HEAT repeat protein
MMSNTAKDREETVTESPSSPSAAPVHAVPAFTDEPLSDAAQAIVDQVLEGETDEKRRAAVAQLEGLPLAEKERVYNYLGRQLYGEAGDWRRAWCVTALAALNLPDSAGLVAERLNPQVEPFEWVRYWAAIALARLQPPNLVKHLEPTLADDSELVRAIALRLLLENDPERYMGKLQDMLGDKDWYSRFAACKVLRRYVGHKPLRERVERKFIPVLVERLQDRYEATDVRFQAARALGSIEHLRLDAAKALGGSLEENLPDWIRRECVDALAELKIPEMRDALLFALRDPDAEIRVRAANALKNTLGATEAVNFIVNSLLQHDEVSSEYLDALRHIDRDAATDALSIPHPDPKIAERALRALTLLGGEAALRTLQAYAQRAVKTYTKVLGEADQQIMEQFGNLIKRAQLGFKVSMWMHGIIFGIGVVLLLVSLYMAVQEGLETLTRFIGVGGAVGSLGTLLLLFYKDPIQNIGHSVVDLVKVNVVFLGYVRQINQIDATFKQIFLSSPKFSTDQMKDTVTEIENAVKQTLENVKTYFDKPAADKPGNRIQQESTTVNRTQENNATSSSGEVNKGSETNVN